MVAQHIVDMVFGQIAVCWGGEEAEAPVIKTLSDLTVVPKRMVQGVKVSSQETVQSAPVRLEQEEVIQVLKAYLEDNLATDFEIQLDSVPEIPATLASFHHDFKLDNVQLNSTHSRIKADLVFVDSTHRTYSRIPISARLDRLIEVPVLCRSLQPDQVITAQDLVWQKIPARRLSGSILTTTESIIGRQARNGHYLAAYTPLRKYDLVKPQAIKRGAIVTASLEQHGIYIQMQAKAMDNGAIGEEIRIMNIDSGKTLSGLVEGLNRVKVLAPFVTSASMMGESAHGAP
jgi:flagella basal body P-ring formation protein FlgA